jgi:hypothetical protein
MLKSLLELIFVALSSTLFLTGCSGKPADNPPLELIPAERLAQDVLVEFFSSLHSGKYQEASELYGGSYDIMVEHNPTVDPSNHATLFQNACEINGAQCLEISGIPILDRASDSEYIFLVGFMREDGSIYSRGPCCGGTQPPERSFSFLVKQVSEGIFLVMDTPVYAP